MVAFSRVSAVNWRGRICSAALQGSGIALLLAVLLLSALGTVPGNMFNTPEFGPIFLVFLPQRVTRIIQPLILAFVFIAPLSLFVGVGGPICGFSALAISCLGCHGVLVKDRPDSPYLPEFLLCIALGMLLAAVIFLATSCFLAYAHVDYSVFLAVAYPVFLAVAWLVCFLPTTGHKLVMARHSARG
jgi:hypothetical protein